MLAAQEHGSRAASLVCLQGQPSVAALTLLHHLHACGTALSYHGGFDWGGIRMASTVLRHAPWRPWRYSAADYRDTVRARAGGPPLSGRAIEAAWDSELPEALAQLSVRVEEE
ncbi:DUF2399 domain-containing protein [Streptomyces exfoliatus]|uniref:DUF2399 domain-containing protein n=1 Tax=Streptomyces exfoliatus TaxID=1905 RepID=A0ABV3D2A5_STREX